MLAVACVGLAPPLAAQTGPQGGELKLAMTAPGRTLVWPDQLPSLAEVVASVGKSTVEPLAVLRLLQDGNNYYAPAWSADGRHLVLIRSDLKQRRGKLVLLDLATDAAPQALYSEYNTFEHMPRWSNSRRGLLFFSSNNEDAGHENLHVFEPGLLPRSVTTGPGTKILPTVTLVGGRPRVIFRREDELIETELSADATQSVNAASLGIGEEASYSPDGSSVAFVRPDERQRGSFAILLRDGQVSKEVPLASEPDRLYRNLTWSPNGQYLAYFSRPREQREWELCTLDVAARAAPRNLAPQVRVQEDFRHVGPAWNPDSRRLWYFDQTGDQGYRPLKWISPDGKEAGQIDYPRRLTSAKDVTVCPNLHMPAVSFVAIENQSFDPYVVLLNHP
jgi:Tol biopolymer transport system component